MSRGGEDEEIQKQQGSNEESKQNQTGIRQSRSRSKGRLGYLDEERLQHGV